MPAQDVAKEVLAGGLGSAFADSLFNPLEIIKVRLQLEGQRGGAAAPMYTSFLQTGKKIAAEDGVLMLWKPGLVATWMRAMGYTGLRVGMYGTVKSAVSANPDRPRLFEKVLAGATTGALASSIGTPVEVVRIRLQGEAGRVGADGLYRTGMRTGHPPSYPAGTLSAFGVIYRTGGAAALWKGYGAGVVRAMLLSGAQLGTYDHCKQGFKDSYGFEEGAPLHLVASLVSVR
jgi:hypothetical protein